MLNGVTQVLSDDGTRIIGEIQDSTFLKLDGRSTEHLCNRHNAIGLDKAIFLTYILTFVSLIVITDSDSGMEYRATVEDFKEFAIEDDLDYGTQILLPLVYWSVIEPNGTKSTQLRLFSEVVKL